MSYGVISATNMGSSPTLFRLAVKFLRNSTGSSWVCFVLCGLWGFVVFFGLFVWCVGLCVGFFPIFFSATFCVI